MRLDRGGTASLVDGEQSQLPERASYSFFGKLPHIPLLLFHVQFGEGNAFAVMHTRTGRVSHIEGWPHVSPNGRTLLIAEDGYFNRIGVFLYELRSDSLARVLALDQQVSGCSTIAASSPAPMGGETCVCLSSS